MYFKYIEWVLTHKYSVLTYKYSKYVLSIKKFLFSLHTKSDWVYLTTLIKYYDTNTNIVVLEI